MVHITVRSRRDLVIPVSRAVDETHYSFNAGWVIGETIHVYLSESGMPVDELEDSDRVKYCAIRDRKYPQLREAELGETVIDEN